MTVSSTITSVSYTGNGSTTAFPVTFTFFGTGTSAEIRVIEVVIATGAETVKVSGTDYTVTGGNGSTGTVTATTAPASTVNWVIRRNTSLLQETDYLENDPFPADSHELALDRLTLIAQEQETDLSRTAQLPGGYTGSFDPTLPTTITADSAIVFNSAGDGFAVGPTTTDISNAATNATAAAASASDAADSASAASASASAAAASASDAADSALEVSAIYSWGGTAGGTANALTLTPATAITAYAAGQTFRFIAASNNTGSASLAVSGLTAKAIQIDGAALSAGSISTGSMYDTVYDGTQFQLSSIGAVSSQEITTSAVTDDKLSFTPLRPDTTDTLEVGYTTEGYTISAAASITPSFVDDAMQTITLNQNITINAPSTGNGMIALLVNQDSTGRTITMSGFDNVEGTPPAVSESGWLFINKIGSVITGHWSEPW